MTVGPNSDTLLVITGLQIPRYSARGLIQTYAVIAAATDQRRTINGDLKDLSVAQFRKYVSKITCTERATPAIDGIFPGAIVTVDCIFELSYPAGGHPQRPEVSGSSRFVDGFVYYRPVLQMMITAIGPNQLDEWAGDYQWEIDLEEI
jgi:hypothetical protein